MVTTYLVVPNPNKTSTEKLVFCSESGYVCCANLSKTFTSHYPSAGQLCVHSGRGLFNNVSQNKAKQTKKSQLHIYFLDVVKSSTETPVDMVLKTKN